MIRYAKPLWRACYAFTMSKLKLQKPSKLVYVVDHVCLTGEEACHEMCWDSKRTQSSPEHNSIGILLEHIRK